MPWRALDPIWDQSKEISEEDKDYKKIWITMVLLYIELIYRPKAKNNLIKEMITKS